MRQPRRTPYDERARFFPFWFSKKEKQKYSHHKTHSIDHVYLTSFFFALLLRFGGKKMFKKNNEKKKNVFFIFLFYKHTSTKPKRHTEICDTGCPSRRPVDSVQWSFWRVGYENGDTRKFETPPCWYMEIKNNRAIFIVSVLSYFPKRYRRLHDYLVYMLCRTYIDLIKRNFLWMYYRVHSIF